MSTQYNFKEATIKDLSNFFPFFKESIKNYFPEYSLRTRKYFIETEYSPDYLKKAMKQGLSLFLAFFNKEVAGYLMTSELVGGVCLANWLAVSEKHQGKGIASKLLKMWEEEAKKAGFHKLHLWTDKRNLLFYKKRGFKFVGKVPDNFYGADDYLFYKSIQKPKEKNFLNLFANPL